MYSFGRKFAENIIAKVYCQHNTPAESWYRQVDIGRWVHADAFFLLACTTLSSKCQTDGGVRWPHVPQAFVPSCALRILWSPYIVHNKWIFMVLAGIVRSLHV